MSAVYYRMDFKDGLPGFRRSLQGWKVCHWHNAVNGNGWWCHRREGCLSDSEQKRKSWLAPPLHQLETELVQDPTPAIPLVWALNMFFHSHFNILWCADSKNLTQMPPPPKKKKKIQCKDTLSLSKHKKTAMAAFELSLLFQWTSLRKKIRRKMFFLRRWNMFTVLLTRFDLKTVALGDIVALLICIFYCPDCPRAHFLGWRWFKHSLVKPAADSCL